MALTRRCSRAARSRRGGGERERDGSRFTRFSSLLMREVFSSSSAHSSTLFHGGLARCFAHLNDKDVQSEPWRGAAGRDRGRDRARSSTRPPTRSWRRSRARCPSTRARWRASFGHGVRTGVTEALRQFVELIRSPSGARGPGREVYVALGRGELRQGRTLDALQSAYRVGARVAWRRLAAAATPCGRRARGAEPAGRIDLRLHRGAVGRLGGGLRRGALAPRGRAPPPAPARAGAAAAPRPARRARPTCERRPAPPAGASRARRRRSRAPRTARATRPRGCPPTRWPPRSTAGLRDRARPRRPRPARPRSSERVAGRRPRSARPRAPAELARLLGAGARGARAVEAGAIEAPGLVRADEVLIDLLLFESGALRRPDRRAPARGPRRAHPQGAPAHGGDGARLRPRARQRRRNGARTRPAPADGPLPARAGCASCSASSSTIPNARLELELALRARLHLP